MLYLLSPSKALDYETPISSDLLSRATEPLFTGQAETLISVMRTKSSSEVAELMDLSKALADLNVSRYAAWQPTATADNSRPAVLAFDGDVYEGMQPRTLTEEDLLWSQEHLAILSGLYGVLRPLDRLQPYRLEMGTLLRTGRCKDLYAFWGDTIAAYLNERLAAQAGEPIVVNLASVEYSRAALRKSLRARVIETVFEDWKTDRYKVISFYAKRARGLMARWAIQNRVESPERLAQFNEDGYAYSGENSTPDRLVFRRKEA